MQVSQSPQQCLSANDAVLAHVVRNGFVECEHRGIVAVTDAGGTISFAAGEPGAPVFGRSSNKPFQTLGMLNAGLGSLDLPPHLIALITASHSGEVFHIEGVREILARAGLNESALQTPPDWPISETAHEQAIRDGVGQTPIAMNCSGKHAGMLATCVVNDWPTQTYRDPDHPLQRVLRAAVAEATGDEIAGEAVDGCGAPIFATSVAGLARGFGAIAGSEPGTPAAVVADAVRAHPEYTSGTDRDERALIAAVPGLFGKAGAEGVYGIGLPDGRGLAAKITDGAQRARGVVLAGVLTALGYEQPEVAAQTTAPVLGHGQPVGRVEISSQLRDALLEQEAR